MYKSFSRRVNCYIWGEGVGLVIGFQDVAWITKRHLFREMRPLKEGCGIRLLITTLRLLT